MSEYLNVTNYTDPKAFHVIRPADVKSPDLPWPGILFALPVTGIYYWCSDQVRHTERDSRAEITLTSFPSFR